MSCLWFAACAALVVGCSESSKQQPPAETKPAIDAAAPPAIAIPDRAFRIRVDGDEVDAITREMLANAGPTYWDRTRLAWPLAPLLGERWDLPDATVLAVTAEDKRYPIRGVGAAGGGDPVLVVREGGAVYVSRLHERPERYGWRLADAEAPGTRIDDVVGIDIVQPRKTSLDLVAGGETIATLDESALTAAATREVKGRKAIDLRQLVAERVGKTARVTAVASSSKRVEVNAAQWKNAGRTPVLRFNRRGALRFLWLTGGTEPGKRTGLRDVIRVEIDP